MDWQKIIDSLPLYFQGFGMTILLTVCSLFIGFALAWVCAVALEKKSRFSFLINTYVYYFRGTPCLIQIYLIYYGLSQFEIINSTFVWVFFQDPVYCAWLTLMLNTGAYSTEIILGGLKTHPKKEIEAAHSLGFSQRQIFWLFKFSGTMRRVIATYSNEAIFLMHATALASSITIIELTRVARMVNARFYIPFEAFLTSAAFYFALSYVMLFIFKKIEKALAYPTAH